MLSDKQLRALPPKAQEYYRRAQKFIADNQTGYVAVAVGSQQFYSWATYFAHMGWQPFMISQAKKREIETIITPTEWPEWFDPDYVPPANPRKFEFEEQPAPINHGMRLRYEELLAKYGDGYEGWGIIPARPQKQAGLTAEKLERMVGTAEWNKIPDLPDPPGWVRPSPVRRSSRPGM